MLTTNSPLDMIERMVIERTKHLEMNSASGPLPAFGSEDWNTKLTCNLFTVIERHAPRNFSDNFGMGDIGGSLSLIHGIPLLLLGARSQDLGLQEIDLTGHRPAAITDKALLQLLSDEESVTGSDAISANGEIGFQEEKGTYKALKIYNALEFPEQLELEDQSRQTQSPETDINSTETPPASGSGLLLAPRHSNPSLCGLPVELLRFVVEGLDDVSRTCLKFSNSYFHSMIEPKCVRHLSFRRRQALVFCLERDVGTYRALLQCSNCKEFRLRMLVPGRAPNRRWTPSRLSFREELRSCCKTAVPPGSTALRMSQYGASRQELRAAECVIDVDKPGMALILVCLHCSAEMVYAGEDVDKQRCTLCGCRFCPLVFMPRSLSVSPVAVEEGWGLGKEGWSRRNDDLYDFDGCDRKLMQLDLQQALGCAS
jgi:hypothetical protein